MGQKVLCLGTTITPDSAAFRYAEFLANKFELQLLTRKMEDAFRLDELLETEDLILLVVQLTGKSQQKKEIKRKVKD